MRNWPVVTACSLHQTAAASRQEEFCRRRIVRHAYECVAAGDEKTFAPLALPPPPGDDHRPPRPAPRRRRAPARPARLARRLSCDSTTVDSFQLLATLNSGNTAHRARSSSGQLSKGEPDEEVPDPDRPRARIRARLAGGPRRYRCRGARGRARLRAGGVRAHRQRVRQPGRRVRPRRQRRAQICGRLLRRRQRRHARRRRRRPDRVAGSARLRRLEGSSVRRQRGEQLGCSLPRFRGPAHAHPGRVVRRRVPREHRGA